MRRRPPLALLATGLVVVLAAPFVRAQEKAETLAEIGARLGRDTEAAYAASPFALISKDYFARFVRDPQAAPRAGEAVIENGWTLGLPESPSPVAERMAGYFADFMQRRMGVTLAISRAAPGKRQKMDRVIVLDEAVPLRDPSPESFVIRVEPARVTLSSPTPEGLRDAVVQLVDRIGFRGAPFLAVGATAYRPRLEVRLGSVPKNGSNRELVFMGYNAVLSGGGSLYALSTSNAISELAVRRQPGLLEQNRAAAAEARAHGLKTYAFLDIRQKFPESDPVFAAHPEIRGARTWRADGEFVLCTEHPLVQQWLAESIQGLFKADPPLSGIVLIIGGEGFYHCFMRPFGVEKGHTNCPRCEALGAETVVANLCNRLAAAARSVSPKAEVVVWPYSAQHVWSADAAQAAFIEKLKPGVALLTEIEKDEHLQKPGGVDKALWDYSIDLIGPGARAQAQIAACKKAGIHCYLKSEPELAFEAPSLPHIPCMDRWVDRAEALASCGASGAWVFPAFRANYGTSAAEVSKFVWWTPTPDKETLLKHFAERLVGTEAGPHLRAAWSHVSAAIPLSPLLPPYYTGPQYLGPAHPMIADPEAKVPDVFYGYYLFMAEIMDAEGRQTRPTFATKPYGDAVVLGDYYRRMERELLAGVQELDAAAPLVSDGHRLMFDAESSAARWFYATARTTANFYEACPLRDKLLAFARGDAKDWPPEERKKAMDRWRGILEDERANTEAALPLVERDMRLDFYYGGDHTFPHAADMIRAKLGLLKAELAEFLPKIAAACGISDTVAIAADRNARIAPESTRLP
jgi:hypothetical protein